MIRLHVTAEGRTELNFVKTILAPHLARFDVFADARCVLTSKDKRLSKEHRGGLFSYQKAKEDILTWVKHDKHQVCRFTTMFDLYALPDDFPEYHNAKKCTDPYRRVAALEDSLGNDLNVQGFIPYIQLHEFEALILADPNALEWEYLDHDNSIANLVDMVGLQNPELIDDGVTTAPSKRILAEIPEYDKATAGVSVAEKIGLPTLRAKCAHFNEWVTKLEKLGRAQ